MELDLFWQVNSFFASIFLGCIFAFLFCFFYSLAACLNYSKRELFISDIVFFVLIGIVNFFFLLVVNNGESRFFVLLGESIGAGVFIVYMGKFCKKVWGEIFKKIKGIFLRAIKLKMFFKVKSFLLSWYSKIKGGMSFKKKSKRF